MRSSAMHTANIAPAYRRQDNRAASAPSEQESTTVRTAILKQIRILQKQEAALGEQLAKLAGDRSAGAIQQRIALQQQIDGIEQQIKALETALLQKDADRKIQIDKTEETPAGPAATKDAKDVASSPANASTADPTATVGSIVNTSA